MTAAASHPSPNELGVTVSKGANPMRLVRASSDDALGGSTAVSRMVPLCGYVRMGRAQVVISSNYLSPCASRAAFSIGSAVHRGQIVVSGWAAPVVLLGGSSDNHLGSNPAIQPRVPLLSNVRVGSH